MTDKTVISTIKKVMPSVVSVMIARHFENVEKEMGHEFYSFMPGHHEPKAKKFRIPKILIDSKGMVQVGGGSGFVIDKEGFILTNKHVISDPDAEYTVLMNDGQKLKGAVVSRDPIN